MISIIVALAKNNVIGYKGKIPWKLSADLKYFAQTTKGHTVIMGRKTYESIGHPLPERKNIIITSQLNYNAPGCQTVSSLTEIIENYNPPEEIFVIGGANIYEQSLPFANKLYITEVDYSPIGDTYFPNFNKNDWNLINEEKHLKDVKNEYDYNFKIYTKK